MVQLPVNVELAEINMVIKGTSGNCKKQLGNTIAQNLSLHLRLMQTKKAFISVLLLLTYSLGFAHNLVPHCEELTIGEQQSSSHHHHEHHQHSSDEENALADQHISHNDHFDLGVYDLIACFLSEMEHPGNDCHFENCFLLKTSDDLTKQFSKTKIVIILYSVLGLLDQNESLSEYNSEFAEQYLSPPLGNSPNRGPPSISC